jgi:hypothetical protein
MACRRHYCYLEILHWKVFYLLLISANTCNVQICLRIECSNKNVQIGTSLTLTLYFSQSNLSSSHLEPLSPSISQSNLSHPDPSVSNLQKQHQIESQTPSTSLKSQLNHNPILSFKNSTTIFLKSLGTGFETLEVL